MKTLIRKNLTDLYPIFLFGSVYGGNHCLSYIYFYDSNQCWFHRIKYNINKYEIMDTKKIDKNLKKDFILGKKYNIRQVENLFKNK
jgi:hypothetical protein